MSASRQSERLKSLLIASVLIILTCFLGLTPYSYLAPVPEDAQSFERVMRSAAPGDEVIELPFSWRPSDESATEEIFKFTFRPETADNNNYYLFVPYYQQRLQLKAGDEIIYDSDAEGPWRGSLIFSNALIRLPDSVRQGELIKFEIIVSTLKIQPMRPLGTLSNFYIGELEALQPSYLKSDFVLSLFMPALIGISFFWTVNCLTIYFLRPKDVVFGWLSGTLLLNSLMGFPLFFPYFPSLYLFIGYFLLLPALLGPVLLGFTFAVINKDLPPSLVKGFGVILLILAIAVTFFGALLQEIVFSFSLPVLALCLLVSIYQLTAHFLKHRETDKLILVLGYLLILQGLVHDFAIHAQLIHDWIFAARINSLLTLMGVALYLTKVQVETSNLLDDAASDLQHRLSEKEEELTLAFASQKNLLESQTISKERRRITQDLHDGVAGHLVTIMALSDADTIEKDEITNTARHALMDLRLVMDTLSNTEADLRFTLATFRDRCLHPVQALGIDIQWVIGELADKRRWRTNELLNIVRILQEALNNALRHGQPDAIRFEVQEDPDGQLTFVVTNSGGMSYSASDYSGPDGMGIRSMKTRAEMLNGKLTIEPLPTGAKVTLTLSAQSKESGR
ncbi:MAG: hypothetical protein KDI36_19440 [Pseudomonadales bacterium]|nr:hypothetical protein [Pseudomonadales bacterium]